MLNRTWVLLFGLSAGCASGSGVTFQSGPYADGSGSCCVSHLADVRSDDPSGTTMRCLRVDYEKGEARHADCGCPAECGCHAEAKEAQLRAKAWRDSPLRKANR